MKHLINVENEFKWTVTEVLWGDYYTVHWSRTCRYEESPAGLQCDAIARLYTVTKEYVILFTG